MRRPRGLVVSFALVPLALAGAACSSSDSNSTGGSSGSASGATKVPVIVAASQGPVGSPLDGPAADGAMLAIKEINKTGFEVGGKKYVLDPHQVDLTDTPANGVAALTTAINNYKPVAVFGPVLSTEAIPDLVVTNAKKVLQFTPSTDLGPLLGTSKATYAIKTYNNNQLYPAMISFIQKNVPGVKRITLATEDNASGQSEVTSLKPPITAAGLHGTYLTYPEDLTSMNSVAQQVKAGNPDVVIMGITIPHITALATALISSKVAKAYSGTGTDCDYPNTHTLGGAVWVCNYIPMNLANPPTAAGKTYANSFKAFTGRPIAPGTDFWSLTEYPFVYAFVDAMKAAGTVTDTDQILAKVHGISGKHAINYKIDTKGQASTDLQIDLIGEHGAVQKSQSYAP